MAWSIVDRGAITGSQAPIDLESVADQLADGSLDPDEVPSWLEPWDEGADDED